MQVSKYVNYIQEYLISCGACKYIFYGLTLWNNSICNMQCVNVCECLKPLQTFRRSFGKSWPSFRPSKLLMNCMQDILFPMFWIRERRMEYKFTVSWCADLFHSSYALNNTYNTKYTAASNRVKILCKNNFASPENDFYYYIYGWISIFIPKCKTGTHPLRVVNSSENKIHPKNTVVLSKPAPFTETSIIYM